MAPKQVKLSPPNILNSETIKPLTFYIHPYIDCLLTHKVSDESAVEIRDALHASGHVSRPWDFPSRLLLIVVIPQDET